MERCGAFHRPYSSAGPPGPPYDDGYECPTCGNEVGIPVVELEMEE
jgi:hypothetical protein